MKMELILRLFQGIFLFQVVHSSIRSIGLREECGKCLRSASVFCISSEASGVTGCWTDILPDLYHSCDQWIFTSEECMGKNAFKVVICIYNIQYLEISV